MKTKLIFFISTLVLLVACKSYKPFTSVKQKKEQVNLIKNKFRLTNDEFKKIKNEDSILFAVAKSLKKDIKLSLIERRLDSFFVSNYNKEELLIMLMLDYNFPNERIELNRKKNADGIDFKSIEEMKKFFEPGGEFDKEIEKVLGIKKKKDSSSKKKQNK